jgi:hypothetical protein
MLEAENMTEAQRDLQRLALAIIEEAIAERKAPPPLESPLAQMMTLGELAEQLAQQPPADDASRFRKAIVRFVSSLDDIARDYVGDDVSGWLHAVKPFLRTIVGWEALTDIGRAAGPEGYRTLHEQWTWEWDRARARRRKA